MRIELPCWLYFVLGLLLAGQACATALPVEGNAERIELGKALMQRTDPSGQLGIAEIAAHPEMFRTASENELHRGFSPDAHWLRIDLVNPETTPLTRWLEIGNPRLESVRLYWRDGETWKESSAGTQIPRAEKAVVAAAQVLPLSLAPGEARRLFIRVSSRSVVDLNVSLWQPLAFRSQEGIYFLKQGAFLASLLLAASFSLLIYLRLRDRVYLLFFCALLFQVINQASTSGILQCFLWPATRPFATEIIACCWGLAVFFHMLVMRDFLDIRHTLPSWNRIVAGLAWIALIGALAVLLFDYRLWIRGIMADTVVCVVLTPLLSLTLLRRGFRAARFLVAGTTVLWLATLLTIGSTQNLIPLWAATIDSLPLATVIASSFILLAVTERTYELRQALTRADAVIEAKATFLAHMSHELRTPLNTIIGFSRLLSRETPKISPREGCHAIEQSGLHLLLMIDELLDHTRAELGKLQLEPIPTAWNGFIDTISKAASTMSEAAGNSFILETQGSFPANLMLDARRLRQVLENLLANANRHTHDGRIELLCRLEPVSSSDRARLHFRLSDTGEGIAPEDRERIFEPFQRARQQTAESGSQGSGLGLTISRQLVALMGGELRLEQTSAAGSCFGFTIECPVLAAAVAWPAMPDAARTWLAGQRKTLLIVEDLAEPRQLLRYQLEGAGFTVVEAASARQALLSLDSHIDLVLTDQFMPDGDGWDVLRGVRSRFPELPIVLFSAADSRRPPDFPSDLDFEAVLGKPFDEQQLFRLIGQLLRIEWQSAENEAAAPSEIALPPAEWRSRLACLAEQGQVTDIKEWIDELLARSPAATNYADAARQALRRLDFQELQRLAAVGNTSRQGVPGESRPEIAASHGEANQTSPVI